MEYCQRCLHTELRRHPGGMPGPLVKVLAWQLVHGLAFLHSNNVGTGHARTAVCHCEGVALGPTAGGLPEASGPDSMTRFRHLSGFGAGVRVTHAG